MQPIPARIPHGTTVGVTPSQTPDYVRLRRDFTWESEGRRLDLTGRDGANMAQVCLDRQVAAGLGDRLAVRYIDRAGTRTDLSYDALLRRTNQCANALRTVGVQRGEAVFALLGRGPALHVAALGALKADAVFCPLFSAFGPEPIATRMEIGAAVALITTETLYLRKVSALRANLPKLRYVLLVRDGAGPAPPDTLDFNAALDAASEVTGASAAGGEDIALMHFTSGTTGKPKGVLLAHAAVIAQHATARLALDLRPGDRFWCTADPGWVTGMGYGVIAPLAIGASSIIDQEEFEPERWYRILEEERIEVWYTAPTAIRMLMKAGTDLARARSYPALRFLASVGEPLNPEAVVWGIEAFGHPFHDNWWQTETGAIMVSNYAGVDIKPGSMGLPVPGVVAAIVRRTEAGGADPIAGPDVVGELALKPGWPSMFRGYLHQEEKYRAAFAGGWYLTGDLARRDADGYFWFVGRADDVIKSAGHLISPFEVESALLSHPAVAMAGVIGKPDEVAGNIVKAFIELKPGITGDDALRRDLLAHARRRLGAAVAPRELDFLASLPRTRSGKIMRRVLRARELGLPEGDVSTLEGGGA